MTDLILQSLIERCRRAENEIENLRYALEAEQRTRAGVASLIRDDLEGTYDFR